MSNEICLDANVFVSMISPDPAHAHCVELFRHIEANHILLFEPALVVFETLSALRKKSADKSMSETEASAALDFFYQLPLFLQWQEALLQEALSLSHRLDCKTTNDTSYLAVATTRKIPFVTLDANFYTKAKQAHFQTYSVEEFLNKILK